MVRLIPRDLGDTPDLASAIKCTDVGAYDPCAHDGRTVAVVFDSKLAGEASNKALQRLPPFQQRVQSVAGTAPRTNCRTGTFTCSWTVAAASWTA